MLKSVFKKQSVKVWLAASCAVVALSTLSVVPDMGFAQQQRGTTAGQGGPSGAAGQRGGVGATRETAGHRGARRRERAPIEELGDVVQCNASVEDP